jgi:hypothetical protein
VRPLAALLLLAATLGACSVIPPTIECGTVDAATCQRLADGIIAGTRADDPTRRIVKLTITDRRGSYSAEFDDGTGTSLIID